MTTIEWIAYLVFLLVVNTAAMIMASSASKRNLRKMLNEMSNARSGHNDSRKYTVDAKLKITLSRASSLLDILVDTSKDAEERLNIAEKTTALIESGIAEIISDLKEGDGYDR